MARKTVRTVDWKKKYEEAAAANKLWGDAEAQRLARGPTSNDEFWFGLAIIPGIALVAVVGYFVYSLTWNFIHNASKQEAGPPAIFYVPQGQKCVYNSAGTYCGPIDEGHEEGHAP